MPFIYLLWEQQPDARLLLLRWGRNRLVTQPQSRRLWSLLLQSPILRFGSQSLVRQSISLVWGATAGCHDSHTLVTSSFDDPHPLAEREAAWYHNQLPFVERSNSLVT